MDRLKVLVVDDEPLAREGLREFVERTPDAELAGECATGLEAIEFLEERDADVVFLDIRMPELDGIGVAAALSQTGGPTIVFVTAFAEHAVQAFELNAVDYLLKPYDYQRFRAALDRVRVRRRGGEQAQLVRRMTEVLAALRGGRTYAERVLVKHAGRIRLVSVDEIDWIEAADNYVRLHVGRQQHLVRETMNRIEERLDPARFTRIHRSTIVQLERIEHLEPTFSGEYTVVLRSGARLTLSRTYRDAVRARLGGDW